METGIKHLHSGDVRQFPWLEAMVAALDDRLRLRHGVIEYTSSSECLFRIQLVASDESYVLSDGTCIRRGDRVANLHVWNEQFPCFAGKGPTLAWARRVNQAFELSLRELAGFLHGAKRRRIARKHHHRDQDILANPVHLLAKRTRARRRDRFKTKAADETHQLGAPLRRLKAHIGANRNDVIAVAAPCLERCLARGLEQPRHRYGPRRCGLGQVVVRPRQRV